MRQVYTYRVMHCNVETIPGAKASVHTTNEISAIINNTTAAIF